VTGFMLPIEELEAEANGTWFISMLGVHLRWRSRGVGSHLLDVADIKRTETNSKGVSLIVEDANDGARKLYQRRGYAVRDQRKMVGRDGDWLLMVKD
jgi:ribosomal protein S18 acetylase RimI-like enzyme